MGGYFLHYFTRNVGYNGLKNYRKTAVTWRKSIHQQQPFLIQLNIKELTWAIRYPYRLQGCQFRKAQQPVRGCRLSQGLTRFPYNNAGQPEPPCCSFLQERCKAVRKAVLDEKNCAVLCIGVCNLRESVIAVNKHGVLVVLFKMVGKVHWTRSFNICTLGNFYGDIPVGIFGVIPNFDIIGRCEPKPLEEYVVP